MPLRIAKDKWEALAQRTKAIILAVISLATIVSTVWIIDARYAKAGEFKQFRYEYNADKAREQIRGLENQLARTNCQRERDRCVWLRGRIGFWQHELKLMEMRK